jgi:glutathione peroxidase
MGKKVSVSALLGIIISAFGGISVSQASAQDFYSLKAKDIQGKEVNFSSFKGKVVVVVNTASKCGFTGQYDGLQKLYTDYKDKGLVVLGFPSNDFGSQEPGTEQEIQSFCKLNYGVDFPMFAKVVVKGENKSDIYKFLLSSNPSIKGEVLWNFEKFLIDKNGKVIDRYRSITKPSSMVKDIEKLL